MLSNFMKNFNLKRFNYLFLLICIIILIIFVHNNKKERKNFVIIHKKIIKYNKDDYNYLLKPNISFCGNDYGKDLLLIAFSTISPDEFELRKKIRETWANFTINPKMRLVFILGNSSNNELNEKMANEHEIFGDLVQNDFLDSYYNLTIKTMMGLRWVSNYCYNAKYALKIDGDVVVNINMLLNYLNQFHLANIYQKNCILCLVVNEPHNRPNRNKNSKFYISKSDYNDDFYPTYCSGPAYLLNIDVVKIMFKTFPFVKMIPFEDVFVGILAKKLSHINFKDIHSSYNEYNENLPKIKDHNKIFFYYSYDLLFFNLIWDKFINKTNLLN